jgi:arsenite-transporting ATPase
MNPEKMVISEARRTYTYLGLFGYGVDSAIVNRVLPDTIEDPYFARWRQIQKEHLATVDEGFVGTDIRHLRLFSEEMVGIENLRIVGAELYGDLDPAAKLSTAQPLRVEDVGDDVALILTVPFAEKGDVGVMRHDDELFLTVGSYRRSLVLPDSLKRRTIKRAKLDDGELRVVFTLEDE